MSEHERKWYYWSSFRRRIVYYSRNYITSSEEGLTTGDENVDLATMAKEMEVDEEPAGEKE